MLKIKLLDSYIEKKQNKCCLKCMKFPLFLLSGPTLMAVCTHLAFMTHIFCSARADSFSPVFSTRLFSAGNLLKGCSLCIGYKWDSHCNKWLLLSTAWTFLPTLDVQRNVRKRSPVSCVQKTEHWAAILTRCSIQKSNGGKLSPVLGRS